MMWVAFFRHEKNSRRAFEWDLVYSAIAASIARQRSISIGLISSDQDKQWLNGYGIKYCDHITGDVSGANGAQTKLKAIRDYLPDGHSLCDMDIIWPNPAPKIDESRGWALNPEPLLLYQDYSRQQELLQRCRPRGKITANAGFLFLPKHEFKEYARTALELSQTTNCIGHTFEQMYFLRFCQDRNIEANFLYPTAIKQHEDVENCYQACGIRHPFSFKGSLQEVQRFVTIGMKQGEADYISWFIKRHFPIFKPMIYNQMFDCLERQAALARSAP